jgi:glycosyltransferase involved in cell wall biosynthesis
MGMVTIILNVYNRGYTLEKQIEAIKSQSMIIKDEDIWVWYNKGKNQQDQPKNSKHRTYVCNENTKFHGRFAAAMLAKTEYVAMLDDDIIPGSKWFENCFDSIQKCNGILGGSGVSIKSRDYSNNIKHGWNGHIKPMTPTRVDLVGHAWFMKKEWLKYMWLEEPFSWDNGEDIMFSYLCQKYGNINTFVPPHPSNDMSMWSNVEGGKIGNDENATYIHTPNHYELRSMVCSKAIDNGWKTVYNIK